MSSRAISYLERKNIDYQVVRYKHVEKGAAYAASATGFPLERTIKTLVVDLKQKNCVLAMIPGNCQLDLKQMAELFSVKRAVMADTHTAQRQTGYVVGGISPFGTRRNLPVVMETGLLQYDRVAINGGKRGVMLIMSPQDILSSLGCFLTELV